MNNPITKESIREEFTKSFKCIQSDCDGTGCIPHQVTEDEWEAQQCQFHSEYLFPILSFLDQAYDRIYNQAIEDAEGCVPGIAPDTCHSTTDFRKAVISNLQALSALRKPNPLTSN